MNGSRTGFVAVAVFAALSGACGGGSAARGTDSSTSPDSSPTPGATATPSLPDGIYVSGNGNDASAGTAHDPLRTIQRALAKAHAEAKRDVFVIGGGANGIFDEVLTLPSNLHLQGSVCPPAEHDTTLTINATACVTALIGGSPAIVASHIDDTEVADFQIAGATPQGAAWSVDGAGCVGHGNNVRAISCDEPADADGRALPAPALAVVVSSSHNVTFTRTRIASATAANGMTGVEGARGADAMRFATSGGSAGASPWAAGGGGSGAVNDACGTGSEGGMGGLGGRWYRGQFSLANNYNVVFTGIAGVSTMGAAGGAAAPLEIYRQRGASGLDGFAGVAGAAGTNGTAATGELDAMSLAAKAGDAGAAGLAGSGGAGGGGGAPGSRKMYVAQGGQWWSESYAGTNDMSNPYYSATHNMGETAAGGGGGGGAAGCAGSGGHGGQSGAVSVALVVRSSTVTLLQSDVAGGDGGAGAAGGLGGEGGDGSAGAMGGIGATTATQLAGSYDAYGNFLLANESAPVPNGTLYYSGSQGGKGGAGGLGGKGGRGGNGGGGAGGSSIGIASIGAQVTLVSSTVTHGLPGSGADSAAAGGAKDQLLVP